MPCSEFRSLLRPSSFFCPPCLHLHFTGVLKADVQAARWWEALAHTLGVVTWESVAKWKLLLSKSKRKAKSTGKQLYVQDYCKVFLLVMILEPTACCCTRPTFCAGRCFVDRYPLITCSCAMYLYPYPYVPLRTCTMNFPYAGPVRESCAKKKKTSQLFSAITEANNFQRLEYPSYTYFRQGNLVVSA